MDERTAGAHETDSAGIRCGTESDEKEAQSCSAQAAPFNMRKRIGSTTYEVEVHFNPDSRETLDEKILRLALNEGAEGSERK